jgi:hypothetical protein
MEGTSVYEAASTFCQACMHTGRQTGVHMLSMHAGTMVRQPPAAQKCSHLHPGTTARRESASLLRGCEPSCYEATAAVERWPTVCRPAMTSNSLNVTKLHHFPRLQASNDSQR